MPCLKTGYTRHTSIRCCNLGLSISVGLSHTSTLISHFLSLPMLPQRSQYFLPSVTFKWTVSLILSYRALTEVPRQLNCPIWQTRSPCSKLSVSYCLSIVSKVCGCTHQPHSTSTQCIGQKGEKKEKKRKKAISVKSYFTHSLPANARFITCHV